MTAFLALVVALAVTGWNAAATQHFQPALLAWASGVSAASVVTGAWLPAVLGERASRSDGFACRFVAGFLAIDLLAFFLFVTLPWSISWCLLAACAVGVAAGVASVRAARIALLPAVPASEVLVTLAACCAVTLWCRDYLTPLQAQGGDIVVQGFRDIFLHVRMVSAIAQSHGLQSLQNLALAGVHAPIYHYASYLPAAAMAREGYADALQAFSTCMVPVGMMLASLAACALGSTLFGRAAGVGAALGLLLVPDALQQGFGNELLAYHCLQAIAPGGLYGVAVAALGWMLLVDACMAGRPALVLVGWAAIASTLAFKAHIFVANASVALLFPVLFMPGLSPRARAAAAIAATLLFAGVVAAVNATHMAPLMRLDGSGAAPYARLLASAQEPGTLLAPALRAAGSMGAAPAVLAPVVMLLTLGVWCALFPWVLWRGRRELRAPVMAFPLVVLATYAVMSSALAYDTNGVGTPEELMHRPFVWAYFVACAWTAGLACHVSFGARAPGKAGRAAVVALVTAALAIPWYFGRDLQSVRLWMPQGDGVHLDPCLVRVARRIRDTSAALATVQVSNGDPRAQWSALSERQAFAIGLANGMAPTAAKDARLSELHALRLATEPAAVEAFMASHSIDWYVAVPEAPVAWARPLDARLDAQCDGFAAYRFGARAR